MSIARHYYEAHVTIDPVIDVDRLEELQHIASKYKFKVASLFMGKGGNSRPSTFDAFMTAHSKNLVDIKFQILGLVRDLQRQGFPVRRYKIEDIVMDSRIDDELELLES